jgi:hypothetical protein
MVIISGQKKLNKQNFQKIKFAIFVILFLLSIEKSIILTVNEF